jgi:hypothetical protein
MLNEFLLAAYKDNQTKLANRQLVDKLKAFDLDDLVALANGDPTAKLASYCDGPSDGPQSWLDKYKGSPLFEKAVELEKSLLEADAAADAKRTEERESDRTMDDQRDALRMQKRMLDLDLALEQEGGAAAAASPEPAVPATPEAPVEQAPSQTAVEVKQAGYISNLLGNEANRAQMTAAVHTALGSGAQNVQRAVERADKLSGKTLKARLGTAGVLGAAAGLGSAAHKKKEAAVGAFISEARSTRDTVHPEARQGNGQLGDYSVDPSETVTEGLQVSKTAAVSKVVAADAAGRLFAKSASVDLSGVKQLAKDRISGMQTLIEPQVRGASAIANRVLGEKTSATDPQAFYEEVIKRYPHLAGKKKEAATQGTAGFANPDELRLAIAVLNRQAAQAEQHPVRSRIHQGLAGAGVGALGGAAVGSMGAGLVDPSGYSPALAGLGAGVGALGGGIYGATRKPGAGTRRDANNLQQLLQHYEATKQAGIAGSLLQGVKTLGSNAKNLATTAHAAGGMPQVAKSFGNVAKNFAQANPLAATGIAAGAAGLGGMALGRATAPNR